MTIRYFKIPVSFLCLGITSVVELMILSLAVGFGDKGIKISNQKLADILHTDRRTIIYAVNRLLKRGFLVRKSAGYGKRILIVNGEKLSLSGNPENSDDLSQNGENGCIKMVNAASPISKGSKGKGKNHPPATRTHGEKPTDDDTDYDLYDACARSLTHDADPAELDEIFKGMPQ